MYVNSFVILTTRPVTSLGHQGGEEIFEGGVIILNKTGAYVQHIFSGVAKVFPRRASHPLRPPYLRVW